MVKKISLVLWLIIICRLSYCDEVEFGASVYFQEHIPCDPYCTYSSSQLIYDSSKFDYPCTINQISFRYRINYSEPEDIVNDITILMGEADLESFDAGYIDPSQLEVSFQGSVSSYNFQTYNNENEGWLVIDLDQPFSYSKEHNLIIHFHEASPLGGNSSDRFYSFTTLTCTAVSFLSFLEAPDLNDLGEPLYNSNALPHTIFGLNYDENYPSLIYPEDNSLGISTRTSFEMQVLDVENSNLTLQSNNGIITFSCNESQMIDENIYQFTLPAPLASNKYYTWSVTYNNNSLAYPSNSYSFRTCNDIPEFNICSTEIINSSVHLEWTPLYENDFAYHIFRNGQEIAISEDNSYIDYQVTLGQTYYYKVKFFFADNSSIVTENVPVEVIDYGDLLLEDDFESYEAFGNNLGEWTNIDNDSQESYYIADYLYPNAGEESAFIVFDPNQTVPPLDLDIQGEKCLVSFAALNPPTSDILITPSFQAYQANMTVTLRSFDTTWGMERIKIGIIYNNDLDNLIYLNNGNFLEIPDSFINLTFSHQVDGSDILTNFFIESCGIQTLMLIVDKVVISSIDTSNDNVLEPVQEINIYPNPIRGGEFKLINNDEQIHVKLYNLKGQLIKSYMNTRGDDKFELPRNITNGLYIVKLIRGKEEQIQKISVIK